MEKVFVVVTMDVEPPTENTHPDASGPKNWQDSEKFIRGYVARAAEFGCPVSFFIHPEVAVEQHAMFEEFKKKNGACIEGLHLHPWKFRDGKYKAHFGGLAENEMRSCLSEAISMWQTGFNRRPLYFRPGTFSANDWMYRVLVDLGFLGGSCSIPGRIWPRMNAVWSGAAPDPHRAHAVFRQLVGDLPFGNMPVSVDFSGTIVTQGTKFKTVEGSAGLLDQNTVTNQWDMRPDFQNADYHRIARNIISQIKSRKASIPVISTITHNDNDFTDPNNRVCKNLKTSLKEMHAAIREAGARPVPATLAQIVDLVLAEPSKMLPFTYT